MEKDKWSQKVIAFQLTIGVREKDLGQVGLSGDRLLVITVPNYQISYSFSFIWSCVCLSACAFVSLSMCEDRTEQKQGQDEKRHNKVKKRIGDEGGIESCLKCISEESDFLP